MASPISPTVDPDPGLRPPDVEPVRVPLRDAPHAAPIDPAAWHETFSWITPRADEMKWASIPWQTDLWEARKLALETGKPIFMWAMNGNLFRRLSTVCCAPSQS